MWILAGVLLVDLATAAVLAVCYHRIAIVDGVSFMPIGGAYISVNLASGDTLEVGQADENGELVFWIALLPLPRSICTRSLFFPPNCVNAIGLVRQHIE